MGYEIPQKLEYKEKIMFGLTIKQLAYAMLFFPIIVGIFFRSNLGFSLRLIFSIMVSTIGIGFMFLDFDNHLKSGYFWLKYKKIETPEKLSKFIPIKEVNNNLIITKDNKKIAILKVEPINFLIKPDGSKEAITSMFQGLLNGIDFPIQILMNTESLNLNDYFSELSKRVSKNKRFEDLFLKYKEHFESVSTQNNILNRNFYLIIEERTDLNIQLQICEKKLDLMGIKSLRITTEEIKELLVKFFYSKKGFFPHKIENYPSYVKIVKHEKQIKKPLKEKTSLKENILKNKDFYKEIIYNLINRISRYIKKEENPNIKQDVLFSRIIYAHGYPRNVETGFLDKIVSSLGNFDFSIHIDPYDIEMTMIFLNKELQKQRADLYSAKTKGILNPSLEIKYEDTEGILRNLQKGKEKLFNVSLYINCRAKTKEELDKLTRRIYAELNSLLIIPRQPFFRMVQGFLSCSPLSINSLKINRKITTEPLSAFFPFTSSFLQADKTGVWLGLNKNNIPLIKDIFKLSNPNGLCLASSGSGKSYMAKLLISRNLLNGTKVMVIDPQGEYRNIVEKFNGQRIDLSRVSKTMINPLDLMGHDYLEKRLALMDLMPIMLGEMTEPQKAFIDRALTEAYEQKAITPDPETWDNEPPILEDVVEVLKKMERNAIVLEKTTIRSLINRLQMYTDGVFSFLNKHTNINFNNQFVCFDIGSMPKQVKPVIMFLVLDYVYMKMKENLERKLLVIDEAWSLLGRTEDASYIFEIVKTCRKYNLALFLINQEVEGMLKSEAGKSVLANSSYTLLMRQKPAVIKSVQETFFLSKSERIFLLTAGIGEGILLMDDEHSEIKIIASPEEHNLITTNPDELLELNGLSESKNLKNPKNSKSPKSPKNLNNFNSKKLNSRLKTKLKSEKNKNKKIASKTKQFSKQSLIQETKKREDSFKIKFDENQRCYRHRYLKQEEVKYLLRKGFKHTTQLGINGKKELYLVKPRRTESIPHCFLTYDIANYLKRFTKKVKLFEATKPDIVFEIHGKKYAIEIETGKCYKNRKKISNKIANLKKEYKNNWFFALTNRTHYKKYARLGKTYTKKSLLNQLNRIMGI